LDTEDVDWLMEAVVEYPEQEVILDVENQEVLFGDRAMPATIPEGHQDQLLTGTWNATLVLLQVGEEIERVAERLPYVSGY
ncbi:MAG: isopropylmalate isomerase, partial [Candidatus Methylomirabilales bacterium]